MGKIGITDLTLRDGHQSLLATRMVTADMLPIAAKLDRVGFWSLETWGGATFDTAIRFLNEDPWERIRKLKAAMPRTPMQMLLRGQNLLGYRNYADDVVEAFVELAARNGVDVFRVFDALNDPRNLETAVRAVRKAGKHVQATISYATTPAHTPRAYVELAGRFRAMGADSVCLKDMAGLLKPFDACTLVRALKKEVGLPVQVHSHATTGMSVATLLKAAEAGADGLDTAISSMAMGTSHSPTETIVEILAGSEYDTGLDIRLLVEIAAYFREVRRKYRPFESSFLGADTRILVAQVPGGMLSNLESQLKEQGAADKIDAVLDEIAVVQKDFGYPPLVTPTSQIVGTQALLNVLFGRYARLSTESQNLLVGNYGATPAAPSQGLVRQALAELKLAHPVTARPADSMPAELGRLEKEAREKAGSEHLSAEDVLTYAMFPQVALTFFANRHKGPVVFEAAAPAKPEAAAPAKPEAAAPPAGRAIYTVDVDGEALNATSEARADGSLAVTVAGQSYVIRVTEAAAGPAAASVPESGAGGGKVVAVLAPMPGTVVRRAREDGATVADKETVVVLEALKMQMEIKSSAPGRVRYRVSAGDSVKAGTVLAEVTTGGGAP